MGVFDSITIPASDGSALETIQRAGSLEDGYFDPSGNWIPESLPQRLFVDGFGIDSVDRPYFDTGEATSGEEAQLWINPATGEVWLSNG